MLLVKAVQVLLLFGMRSKEKMKTCKDCKVEKLLSEYHKNKNTKDGVTIVCKPCAIERSKKWQSVNRDKVNAVCRKNYAKNLEQSRANRRERVRRWYTKHPEKARAATRAWSITHPEAKRLSENKRRVMKLGNGVFAILPKEINKLLSSDCNNCGTNESITLDHIIPVSRGGRHSIGNLQSLCRFCNSSKNSKTIMEWRISESLGRVG
jgi:5-methylcytosine-specific restriction endonuclease McrA